MFYLRILMEAIFDNGLGHHIFSLIRFTSRTPDNALTDSSLSLETWLNALEDYLPFRPLVEYQDDI